MHTGLPELLSIPAYLSCSRSISSSASALRVAPCDCWSCCARRALRYACVSSSPLEHKNAVYRAFLASIPFLLFEPQSCLHALEIRSELAASVPAYDSVCKLVISYCHTHVSICKRIIAYASASQQLSLACHRANSQSSFGRLIVRLHY